MNILFYTDTPNYGGAEKCIIDCENSGRGFYFHSGEGAESVVSGFTITNGNSNGGGGIRCDSSSPTSTGNVIIMNSSPYWAGGIIDEIADCKPKAWTQHVSVALADSQGWCILLGVPEGLNFYAKNIPECGTVFTQTTPDDFKIEYSIKAQQDWACYSWWSELVLSEEKLDQFKRTMDERTYAQELRAAVHGFEGLMYYNFDRKRNVNDIIAFHSTEKPLRLVCDFNKSPMVWEVTQLIIESHCYQFTISWRCWKTFY